MKGNNHKQASDHSACEKLSGPAGGGNDEAVIVNLELNIRPQPGSETISQFNVVAVQFFSRIIAVGRHDAGSANSQMNRGGSAKGMSGMVSSAFKTQRQHIIQCAVGPQFRDKTVDFAG